MGMTPMQQLALSYAWTVLRMLGEQRAVAASPGEAPAYCSRCGTRTKPGGMFCTKCGGRL